jgi:hypothetical protein
MSSGSYQGGTVSQPSPWLCIIVHIYPKDNKHIETYYNYFQAGKEGLKFPDIPMYNLRVRGKMKGINRYVLYVYISYVCMYIGRYTICVYFLIYIYIF